MSTISPETARTAAWPAAGVPRAARVQAPGWRDPRLIAGLLLIFAAVAVGARVMAVADHTVPVYAARMTLPTGTPLTSGQLEVVRLRLSGTGAKYLDARRALPVGQILLRPVGAGELVPVAALSTAGQVRLRPVSIPIDGPAPAGLRPGGIVDIWASAKAPGAADGAYLGAQRIASSLEVSQVVSGSGGLGQESSASVQVLLPGEWLPAVLNALANDARIAVLPIPGASSPGEAGQNGQNGQNGDGRS